MDALRGARRAVPSWLPRWALVGAALAVVGGLVPLWRALVAVEPRVVGTNSVNIATFASDATRRSACTADLVVPPGTRAIDVAGATRSRLPVPEAAQARLVGSRGEVRARLAGRAPLGEVAFFTLRPQSGSVVPAGPARLCVRAPGGKIGLGGAGVSPARGVRAARTPGVEGGVDIAVRFLGSTRSAPLYDRVLASFGRIGAFFPGPSALLVVLSGAGTLALLAVALSFALRGRARRVRHVAAWCWAIGVASAFVWVFLTPIFAAPDESEHVAYVQALGEGAGRADSALTARPPYSSEEAALLGLARTGSSALNATSRPRWGGGYDEQYRENVRGAAENDGGGYTISASGHSPLYYGAIAPAYAALDRLGASLPANLLGMRMVSAVLGSLLASIAVGAAALLMPRSRATWWLAGLIVALHPGLAAARAGVNNDTLVILAAGVGVLAGVALTTRGLEKRSAVALGAAAPLLPISKITGLAVLPPLALAAVIALVRARRRWRSWARPVFAGVVAVVLASLLWVFVASPALFGESGSFINVHPAAPVTAPTDGAPAPPIAGPSFGDRADYVLQTLLPVEVGDFDGWIVEWPLRDVYVTAGWGGFGFSGRQAAITQTSALYLGLVVLTSFVAWAAFMWVGRRRPDRYAGAWVFVVSVPLAVITFVAYAYFRMDPVAMFGEQGRYLFTAAVPLALLFAAGADRRLGRFAVLYGGFVVAFLVAFGGLAWLAALRGWYL